VLKRKVPGVRILVTLSTEQFGAQIVFQISVREMLDTNTGRKSDMLTEFSVVFPQSFHEDFGVLGLSRLRPNHFLLSPFQFIIHQS
jgi:hypothetical protein